MTNRQEHALPIDAIRAQVCGVEQGGRLVLSSPTGSGKSTQVPRWFRAQGRVLVVEPRRVACRSLADRVAHLDGHPLGTKTGYIVRDENKTTPETQVIFATPGVVLRMIMGGDHTKFDTIIIDEFHERSLDTDLLLALLREEKKVRGAGSPDARAREEGTRARPGRDVLAGARKRSHQRLRPR